MAQPKPKPGAPPARPQPGAPAAGPGGQKAGGTAVPPKQPKPPPAPKPPRAPAAGIGTQPAAGRPTQPLTQRPGQAPRPLNVQQQNQVQKAAQGGTLDQYMASHPGVAKHYGKVQAAGTAGQQGKYQTLQQQNQAAQAGQPGATGAPAAGAGGGKPNSPGAQPTPAPTPPGGDTGGGGGGGAAPTTFEEAFNAQFGQGAMGQFGPPAWTGPDPIQTARAAAQRGLQEDLAGVRARYAGSGFGNSAREALAEGQATGDFATKFGDIAAQRGMEQQTTGLDRLASMFGTAGAQNLQGQQIGLEANKQLADLGTGLTGIGAQEQGLPNQSDFITLLTNMGITNTLSQGAMRPPKQ